MRSNNFLSRNFGPTLIGCSLLGVIAAAPSAFAQSTTGTLYIEQVGATGSTTVLSPTGTALFLDSFANTTLGSLGTENTLNLTAAGTNSIVDSGSATSEGVLTQTGNYLTFVGYDAAIGTANLTGSTTIPRGVGIYNLTTGTVDDTTELSAATTTGSFSGNNIRSATTIDGTNIYVSGAGGATGGVRSTTDGATASTAVETTSTSTGPVENFNGNIYFSVNKTTPGIFEVTGTASSPATILTSSSIVSPFGFVFADNGNTLYVADSTNGILKFTSTNGVFGAGLSPTETFTGTGFSALTLGGTDNSGNNILYALTGAGTTTALYSLDDTGSGAQLTQIETAPSNTAFRGIAFVPNVAPAPEPSGLVAIMIGSGVLGLMALRRRRMGDASL